MTLVRRWSSTQKKWYNANLERERTRRRTYSIKFREQYPERELWKKAKDRARNKHLDFNIEESDVIIPELCPILRIKLERYTPFAPSIDRIDNSKGYVKGNVWVISRKANTMKANASLEELKVFGEWLKTL